MLLPCLTSWGVVVAGSASLLVFGSSDSHSDSAVLGSCSPFYSDSHGYSVVLGSCSCFYTVSFAMHAGIAFCILHAGIACLVSRLHAGTACLALLACDWLLLISTYPRVSVVSLAMIGGYWSFVEKTSVMQDQNQM